MHKIYIVSMSLDNENTFTTKYSQTRLIIIVLRYIGKMWVSLCCYHTIFNHLLFKQMHCIEALQTSKLDFKKIAVKIVVLVFKYNL